MHTLKIRTDGKIITALKTIVTVYIPDVCDFLRHCQRERERLNCHSRHKADIAGHVFVWSCTADNPCPAGMVVVSVFACKMS